MGNNINDVYEGTIDVLIKFAVSEVADRMFDEIENSMSDDEITFSEKHKNNIASIIDNEKNKIKKIKHRRSFKNILTIAAVIILMILLSVLTVSAFREKIINFFTEISPVSTVIHYESDEENLSADFNISTEYIPDGFEISQEYSNSNEYFARYTNGKLTFDINKQIAPDNYGINTENTDVEVLIINGTECLFGINGTLKTITWVKYGYVYTVSGNIDKNTLIKISEGIF